MRSTWPLSWRLHSATVAFQQSDVQAQAKKAKDTVKEEPKKDSNKSSGRREVRPEEGTSRPFRR
jgi:hypothetical protein